MKATTPALVTYLNGLRTANGDAPLYMADLFTITLASGAVLTYCGVDAPAFWNGYTYLANSVLIAGLKYKASCGPNVDKQQIVVAARATDTVGGVPFLQALQQGLLDGAFIQRERAFFSSWATSGGNLIPIGTVMLFKGRVAQIDEIGRTTAKVTVASDLTLLDIDMPRNCYQSNCVHVLYGSGCGLARGNLFGVGRRRGGFRPDADRLGLRDLVLSARDDHFHVRRQHRRRSDDQGGGFRLASARLSAAERAERRRRLHGGARLRSHEGDLQQQVQQSE